MLPVSEAQWTVAVGDMLDAFGWSWIHHRPARRANGKWSTPVQGNSGRGWPDLFCVRDGRALALELKTEKGRVSPEQTAWLEKLRTAGIEAHIVRLPADWDFLDGLLRPDPQQLTLTTSTSTGATWLPQDERI
jgi:hypothetical protein